jgi:hypothetical protein
MEDEIDVVDILNVDVETGQIQCTVGDATSGYAWTKGCPIIGIDGFYSLPVEYTQDGSAEALTYDDGTTQYILGYWDHRYEDRVGTMKPGDRAISSRGHARFLLKDASDSINMVSKAADLPEEKDPETGAVLTDMGISILGDNGGESSISLTLGTSIVQVTKDEILLSAGGTQIVINTDGVSIYGKNFMCNTGGGNLGLLAPGVAPVKGAQSVLMGPIGQAGIASLGWTVS